MASLLGSRLPELSIQVQPFQTTTEASSKTTRLIFSPKAGTFGARQKRRSAKDEFSARVQKFFETTVLSEVHEAAIKDALKSPTDFETILHALERPEVAAAIRDQNPLAMARLRGIEPKRRILTGGGGLLSAEKVGEILTITRQAVEKRRKAGRLIGVSLGRRGFGYPAWQFSERGTLPGLEMVLDAYRPHDAWTKLVFITSANAATGGKKPLDLLRSVSQRWSRAIQTHPEEPHGILYRPRHDPARLAAALFDRTAERVTAETLGTWLDQRAMLAEAPGTYAVALIS